MVTSLTKFLQPKPLLPLRADAREPDEPDDITLLAVVVTATIRTGAVYVTGMVARVRRRCRGFAIPTVVPAMAMRSHPIAVR